MILARESKRKKRKKQIGSAGVACLVNRRWPNDYIRHSPLTVTCPPLTLLLHHLSSALLPLVFSIPITILITRHLQVAPLVDTYPPSRATPVRPFP